MFATVLPIFSFILLVSAEEVSVKGCKIDDLNHQEIFRCAKIDGDLTLGAIFPIRQYKNDEQGGKRGAQDFTVCNGGLYPPSVLESEAYFHFFNRMRGRVLQKTGIPVGTWLTDTCYSSYIAFKRVSEFVVGTDSFCKSRESHDFKTHVPIIIGTWSSDIAVFINKLFSAYCVPMLALFASSAELTNPETKPFFFRIVPSDEHKVKGILALLKKWGWANVDIITEDSYYASSLTNSFKALLQDSEALAETERKNLYKTGEYDRAKIMNGTCNIWSHTMLLEDTSINWDWLYRRLNDSQTQKNGSVFLLPVNYIKLQDIAAHLPDQKQIQVLTTYCVHPEKNESRKRLAHAIAFQPQIEENLEFQEYMARVTIQTAISPWLVHLISQRNGNCTFPPFINCTTGNCTQCPPNATVSASDLHHISSWRDAEQIKNGLKIVEDAIVRLWTDHCQHRMGLCQQMKEANGSIFADAIRKVHHFWK